MDDELVKGQNTSDKYVAERLEQFHLCNSITVQMVSYNAMTLALNILFLFSYASVNLTN